jgi:hypothetical protein
LNLGPHAFETGTVITWATLPALFVLGIFKIGSHTLFAQGKLMCNVFLFLNIESSSYILDKSLLLYIWLHKTTFSLWLAFHYHNIYF